jgi:ABC-type antimicrobial peptide transport system permease subunit
MDALMAELLRGRRFALIMLATFAAIAMTLAVIGLYGVVAYGVTRRQREFGIRMALGARQREILRLVVGEGMRMAAAGGVIGCAIAVVAGRVLTSFLFGVGPYDAVVLSGVTLALMCVAILACLIPARRAARLDCVEVLRAD